MMENMKLEPEVLRPVLHKMSDISKNRQIFLDDMRNRLEEIVEELRSAKSSTDCPEKIQKLDINVYKQRLVRLSQKIRDFKESCQLETLSQEQITLESELREVESNLHKYQSATDSKPTSVTSSNKESKKCNDYKGIQDFHALIAKTGYTDNWSDEDHLLFLKTRKKCNSIASLVTALQVKCPDLTAKIIVNHEAWYKIYLNLREKQRSSIKEWRKQKEMEKMKNCKSEIGIESLKGTSQEKTISNVTEKLPTRRTDKCERTITKIDVNNTDRKKELIKRWKIDRENKRLIDEKQSKILIESELTMLEKRKRERWKSVQEALKEYRERKSIEISSKASKDNSRTKPQYNPMLIKAFRKQDEEYINKKKNLIAKQQKSANNRVIKKTRSQLMKKRDYSTLLNSTEVWRERYRTQDLNTNKPKKLQYIKDVPRLYVQWRNKESGDQGCPDIF
ncbi:LOW QUALITY PROTEIN: coiled-coil domain-containing protein 112-like [Cataglyphis hispanica]|uniref:LOW QUALITY PROTEIN: coiled-coil domain-containing protein 112-like n=1 Tax=Cataglyphis hispanica TaxID=1086592 RepID=UPI00217FE5A5|nr:LOW QUALITY PROTEIN: coiled-coil domain-containing protein 112-like [Cataglyphis hispanica]